MKEEAFNSRVKLGQLCSDTLFLSRVSLLQRQRERKREKKKEEERERERFKRKGSTELTRFPYFCTSFEQGRDVLTRRVFLR